jgi:hypothetical protein
LTQIIPIMKPEKISLSDQLSARKYDPQKPVAPQQIVLTVRDKVVAVNSSYIIISGLPKAGKSTFISAAIASAFIPGDIFGIKLLLNRERRLGWFDTETASYDWHKQIDRIKTFSNYENLPNRIDAFNVREDDPGIIKKYISHYLDQTNCGVLVVDGLLDLVNNFNDEAESKQLSQYFKLITKKYDCVIIGVLHLGKRDLNSLGHLGSYMDRYANSVLEVEKQKENQIYILKSKYMRSDEDFEAIGIKFFDGTAVLPAGYRQIDLDAYKTLPPVKKKKPGTS